MFRELNQKELEEWNKLTPEQKEEEINNKNVQIAVDVEIKLEVFNKIVEEHKFYQVSLFLERNLIDNVNILGSTENESFFSINGIDDKVSIKTNETKEFEVGKPPYVCKYIIKVSNVTYGFLLDV